MTFDMPIADAGYFQGGSDISLGGSKVGEGALNLAVIAIGIGARV